MELTNTFDLSAPIDEAWAECSDLGLIAPSIPGAHLEAVSGEVHRGTLEVELGPTAATYQGTARIIERDKSALRIVIDAQGTGTRGEGNVNALITARLSEAEEGTHVELVTDLTLTGEMAGFARGVLADASANLIGRFVENLGRDLFAGDAGDERTTLRRVDSPEADAADLLEAGGVPIAKKVLPSLGVLGVLGLILLIIRVMRGRSK